MNATSTRSASSLCGSVRSASISTTSYPSALSAPATAAPVRNDTSRSTLIPPSSTPIRFFLSSSFVIASPEKSDALHLGGERDAALLRHPRAGQLDERDHVLRRRAAEVHDEVRVQRGDLRPPHLVPLEPHLLDEPPGKVARWVLEDAPEVGQRQRP